MVVRRDTLSAVLQKCPAGKQQTTQIVTDVFLLNPYCIYTYLYLFSHVFMRLCIQLDACVLRNPYPPKELVYKLNQLLAFVE